MEGTAPGYAVLGPYVVSDKIAAGGMATIHLGRLHAEGRSRLVAVKRLRPELATDVEFVTMFLDESRMARRIRHPNVVETLDVVSEGTEHFIVMEYVHGESLHYFLRALRRHQLRMPLSVVGGVMQGALLGLHAAHEVTGDDGAPLGLVHRDVSPHNVLLGVDGVARLLDFGVAKARGRAHQTRQGLIKGKIQYMSPEQIKGKPLDRRTDVFSAGIVLWEALVGQPLFAGSDDAEILARVLRQPIPPPSGYVPVSPEIDALVLRALARDQDGRFGTAREMSEAIRAAFPSTDQATVGQWVADAAQSRLLKRSKQVEAVERAAAEVRGLAGSAKTLVMPAGELFLSHAAPRSGEPATDPEQRVSELGRTPSGEREWVNAPAVELDLLPPASVETQPLSSRTLAMSPDLGSGVVARRPALAPVVPSQAPPDPARISLADIGPSSRAPAPRPSTLRPRVGVAFGAATPEYDSGERSLGERMALPVKLFLAAIALVVFETILTPRVGFRLALGFLTPSLVAGVLASVSVLLGVWGLVGAEITGRSRR